VPSVLVTPSRTPPSTHRRTRAGRKPLTDKPVQSPRALSRPKRRLRSTATSFIGRVIRQDVTADGNESGEGEGEPIDFPSSNRVQPTRVTRAGVRSIAVHCD
jgi:hypothetical protein